MDNGKIGLFIKMLRKEKNLTQKDLAEKLGITDRAISKWERGLGCPDVSLLEDLSKELDVSVLEILRGEKIEEGHDLDEVDLLETMHFSKKNTLRSIGKWNNLITGIIVGFSCLFIVGTNIKSIIFLNRSYAMYMEDQEYNDHSYLEEYNNKIDIISNNQGIYSDADYATIRASVNIMKTRLEEQHNANYLAKKDFSYIDILNFYLEHQNIETMEIDNIDLYKILLTYDTRASDNMLRYESQDNAIKREFSNIFWFLQQPYFIENHMEYKEYYPNIHGFIYNLYTREIMLYNDIIRIGGLQ